CVSVEKVVLHLAHDSAENRQIAGQDVQHGHTPQRMGDAPRLLENLYELMPIDRIAPKLCVDVPARVPQCAERLGGHTCELASLLHDKKRPEDERRIAVKAILAPYRQAPANGGEIIVYELELVLRQGEEPFFYRLQQYGVELAYNPGRP